MKSGPFPPPAPVKANSLNRGVSPNDVVVSACEEDQRIHNAHGIIQQLTNSVLFSPYLSDNYNVYIKFFNFFKKF